MTRRLRKRKRSWSHGVPVIVCPECRSTRTHVTTSARRLRPQRYHKCGDCGCTFKSVECVVVGEKLPAGAVAES